MAGYIRRRVRVRRDRQHYFLFQRGPAGRRPGRYFALSFLPASRAFSAIAIFTYCTPSLAYTYL